jgi:hypothetical protein
MITERNAAINGIIDHAVENANLGYDDPKACAERIMAMDDCDTQTKREAAKRLRSDLMPQPYCEDVAKLLIEWLN